MARHAAAVLGLLRRADHRHRAAGRRGRTDPGSGRGGHGRPAPDRGRAIGGLLLAGSLGGLALAAAGTAVTPLLTSAQGASPLLTLTYLPLIIFSGGFGGLSGLPHWLNTLMSYLPAQPMIDAVTRALQPSAGLSGRDLAVLAAWALGGLLLSVRFFRWDPTRPRHARSAGAGNPARSV